MAKIQTDTQYPTGVPNDPAIQEFQQFQLPDYGEPQPFVITAPDGSPVVGQEGTAPITAEINGLNIGKFGHIRGGQSNYNTGTGFFLGYYNGSYVFSIGVGGSTSNNLTFANGVLTLNGYLISGKGAFGGDGSDGALSISSGTTTISAASAKSLIKNYSSIGITGTAKLAFSTPHTNGTLITLKSQGAVTLTSSTNPLIDVSNMGAAGGGHANNNGDPGSGGVGSMAATGFGSGGLVGDVANVTGGAGGASPLFISGVIAKSQFVVVGAGGGAGGSGTSGHIDAAGGLGGLGGGALLIECGGALNSTGTITAAGNAGLAGDASSIGTGAGGGGGGGAGSILIMYNTLTANTGTYTVTGGAGGAGGNGIGGNKGGSGGGGGGAAATAGTKGSDSTTSTGGAGQSGGTGYSFVVQNLFFP